MIIFIATDKYLYKYNTNYKDKYDKSLEFPFANNTFWLMAPATNHIPRNHRAPGMQSWHYSLSRPTSTVPLRRTGCQHASGTVMDTARRDSDRAAHILVSGIFNVSSSSSRWVKWFCMWTAVLIKRTIWTGLNSIIIHGPLARYVKSRVAHAPGMPGTFSPPPRVSDPDMHHGTCVAHVPCYMPGSLTSGFLWSRWREKRSRHSWRMRNPIFCVSVKRSMQ